MSNKFLPAFILFWFCVGGLAAIGQEVGPGQQTAGETEEISKIKAAIESYVAAFNAHDVNTLTAHWSPSGVYTSPASGEQVIGRAAMAKSFANVFADESAPKLAVATDSIDFISPSVAIEKGSATVTHSSTDVVQTQYNVIYVKINDAWLIDRVTEDEIVIEDSHFDELRDLEWLVGDWSMQGDGFRVEFSCQWTTKQNFISRSFKVYGEQDEVESSGLQVIGWDAKAKKIQSWLFDSDGGVVNGTWNKRDNGWTVQCVATLADGGSGSYTCILRPQDNGNLAWKKINRTLDGKLLPNIDEVVFQKQ